MRIVYESCRQQPLNLRAFLARLAKHFGAAGLLLLGSLMAGVAGFLHFEGLSSHDAFLNAATLLSGMGPVRSPQTLGGKIFAGVYALYAGLVFVVIAGILLAPVAHRLLHKFHWEGKP